MDVLKTVGRRIYFQVRRLKKAMRNWKKFGVIIFGGLVLAMNVLPVAQATADTRLFEVYVGMTGQHTVAVGTPVGFTAQSYIGADDATTDTSFNWEVRQGTALVTSRTGGTASYSFTPTAAGTYAITTRGIYQPNPIKSAWAKTPATLTVTGGTTDMRLFEVYVGYTGQNSITVGTPAIFHAESHIGADDATTDTSFNWQVKRGTVLVASTTDSGKDYTFTPTTAGTYTITTRGIYRPNTTKSAWAKTPATLTATSTTPPEQTLAITITPAEEQHTVVGTQLRVPYQARPTLNGQPLTGGLVQWYVNGAPRGNGINFPYDASMVAGTYAVRAVLSYDTLPDAQSNVAYVYVAEKPEADKFTTFYVYPDNRTLILTPGADQEDFHYVAQLSNGDNITPEELTWPDVGFGQFTPILNGRHFTATQLGSETITITAKYQGETLFYRIRITVLPAETGNPVLTRVTIEPPVAGPLSAGGAGADYTARAYAVTANGEVEVSSQVNFLWEIDPVAVRYIGTLQALPGQTQVAHFTPYAGVNGNFYDAIHVVAYFGSPVQIRDARASVLINDVIITQDHLTNLTVAPDRSVISTNDSTPIRAQAYSNGTPLGGASYSWQIISGTATLSSLTGQVVTLYSNIWTGNVVIQVTANYNADPSISRTTTVFVQGAVPPINTINLVVEPLNPTVVTNNTQLFTARVYDSNGANITNLVDYVSWFNQNPTAGTIVSQSRDNMIWRADSVLGTFPSAIRVETRYGGMADTEYITPTVIISGPTPFYFISPYFYGVIEDGSTPNEGDIIIYTITLTNNQPNMVSGVQLTTDVPAYTTFISATSAVDHPRISGRTITWDAGTLYSGGSQTLTVRVRINEGLPKKGISITGYAHVRADQLPQGFNITSNTIVVGSGSGTPVTPTEEPLAPTGVDWQTLVMLALASMLLAGVAMIGLERRAANRASIQE
ncbi:MAG: hypothetical protein VE98_C0001G0140 [candidate division Kazan bacterium GW2011_GWA1_50_15]|uniref:Conserved repeat-like protein n=2 Tax=Bacteria division Kazan-3B-28 TaxID=1798534 RepID=A0A0G2A3V0_UNCK3|nr:MAG: hypothetical protein VE98_C0001G0140 [candidate division Kazan bacterium GW2011_GWA1_50_15]KKW25584.1 MAG: Conserved repeat-like protein [candidate division Kazan bacterium GW2011_GWC1_52_13]KKW26889.1 MAG: Conserved repeat-like protein [candidate division Kazan bacterium GW2011_GWB1_52_7]